MDDVGNVRCQFGEERYFDGGPDPAANVPDELGILTTGKAHTSLSHSVGTGKVEL